MSTAWNANGDVERKFGLPLGAMRKAFLGYKSILYTLGKLTLNGITYDFGKQAKEGLVVCGYQYNPITFFLPDNREPITAEQGTSMTINSYFEMLVTTDYAEIVAWDYFAKHVSEAMGILNSPENETGTNIDVNSPLKYSISSNAGIQTVCGEAALSEFMTVKTFKDFFKVLNDHMEESSGLLSDWMLEDGAISFSLSLSFLDESLAYNIIVGRK